MAAGPRIPNLRSRPAGLRSQRQHAASIHHPGAGRCPGAIHGRGRRVERATLLGNSLGCRIIGEFNDHFPDRVERIIFVSPAGGLYNQPLPKGLSQLIVDTLREPPGWAIRHHRLPRLRPGRGVQPHPLDARLPDGGADRRADVPTLVVLGSRDPFVSERWVKRRAAGLPHVTAVTINGAAHAINYSHPEQLANVVRSWMADEPIVDDPALPGRARVFLRPAEG